MGFIDKRRPLKKTGKPHSMMKGRTSISPLKYLQKVMCKTSKVFNDIYGGKKVRAQVGKDWKIESFTKSFPRITCNLGTSVER